MSVLLSFLLLAAAAETAPTITREPDGTVVIHHEIAADPAPAPLLLGEEDDVLDRRAAERERDTRRAFEEAIDQARSARPF